MSKLKKFQLLLLFLIGFLQMIGFATNSPKIRGLGFSSAAAPLPFVFSQFRGIENFASDYYIKYTDINGVQEEFKLGQSDYHKLKGPYNRRNPYGAVLAYGPMLTSPTEVKMRDSILKYGICNNGPLAQELVLEAEIASVIITNISRTAGDGRSWNFEVVCN